MADQLALGATTVHFLVVAPGPLDPAPAGLFPGANLAPALVIAGIFLALALVKRLRLFPLLMRLVRRG